ncbi:MAG TPA: CoA transferase [Candidatus Dormibacteraeota bacterium]|nr:CoA transferase [Candidatus Dormibacteraeota bacterium]
MGDVTGPDRPLAPLSGYRALDLTDRLGWLCGKVLADLGADVVKVERPGGDRGRSDRFAWLAFNAGKRSIVLDLGTAFGRGLLLRMASGSDFLVATFTPAELARLRLGYEELAKVNPRLIVTSITPYGSDAPDPEAAASDLEIMAAGGPVSLAGDPDRPPVRVTLPQAAAWTGLQAAVGTLIAHHNRRRTGKGQHVDVSAQASMSPMLVQAPMWWSMLRQVPHRSGPYLTGRNVHGAPTRNIWRCADGYVTFAFYGGGAGRVSNRELIRWMASRSAVPAWLAEFNWDAFDPATVEPETLQRLESALAPFFASLTKKEFEDGCVQRRILGYAVATAADIAVDEQLAARGSWQDLPDAESGKSLRYPVGYARFDGRALEVSRPAPRCGEHQAEVLAEFGLAEAQPA